MIKAGTMIRVVEAEDRFQSEYYFIGDIGEVIQDCTDPIYVDFKFNENPRVVDSGKWWVTREDVEVIE